MDGLYLDDRFPEPAIAVRIAQDFGCPQVLPAAYYLIACTESNLDWTRARQDAVGGFTDLRMGKQTVRWDMLDRADLMRVISGRELVGHRHCQ